MTISELQRRRTEERIRAAIDRLLRGQIPPGGGCDVKTLAHEAGVSRASLYRTYQHLKDEFEQRLARIRDAGQIPDPRAAQILRLTDENARLREKLADRDRQIAELTALKTTAISRLAAQHAEITGLRAALADTSNVRALTSRRPTTPRPPRTTSRTRQ
jgi:chromosome segregation ATPase